MLDRSILNPLLVDYQVHDLPSTTSAKDVWCEYEKVRFPTGDVFVFCSIHSTSPHGWALPKKCDVWKDLT